VADMEGTGLGAAEAQRRHLSEAEIEEIVRTEVAERLRQEAQVLTAAIGTGQSLR